MKKIVMIFMLSIGLSLMPTQKSHAVVWVVVKAVLVKVIKAMDLAVQRLQNKTIWLQNAQKTLENTLSKVKLDEISDWVKKNKEQYAKYYDELAQVKEAITGYKRVKAIMEKQVRVVEEYKRAFGLFKQDKHFTPDEINYMTKVYSGIVDESLKNLDQLFLVVGTLGTKMSDGKRLEIINKAAEGIDETLGDLRMFNSQNVRLSLQRSKDLQEVQTVKALYGIE
ncbi:conjugal transfer protein TraI [Niabella ginsenosidivorans]|uniref:Conjugal transfer protein TraI n=1 Tax=Niabella ginsenosidivorans TaxID=1176587 RepID=A0A1A9I214_9BACT|nr:conjugal transfer protein TraI [Niabella ginsenosidivorans]ANH81697.1 conjugal transfer protein TraI [Niabella ginsenosidivorans]